MDNNRLLNSGPINPASSELVGLFEDILNRGLSLRIKVTGRSMAPFLKGGEILTIKKVSVCSLRKGDLLFFRNEEFYPVIHRIIRIQILPDGDLAFQTKGDALFSYDKIVMSTDVFGKVCGIEKLNAVMGVRYIDMESYFWRNVNYLLAIINSGKSLVRYRLAMLIRPLRQLSGAREES